MRDIAAAVRYVKSRADVEPSKVAVYGMSYGGVMTSLALSKLPDLTRGRRGHRRSARLEDVPSVPDGFWGATGARRSCGPIVGDFKRRELDGSGLADSWIR